MFSRGALKLRLVSAVALLSVGVLFCLAIGRETPVGSLIGKVITQESGNPIQASVYLSSIDQTSGRGYSRSIDTKDDGSFSIQRIPAGEYSLKITGKVHTVEPAQITIEEGKTATIVAELAPEPTDIDLYIHQHIFTPDEQPQVTCRGHCESEYLAVSIYKVDINAFLHRSGNSLGELLGVHSYSDDQAKSAVRLESNAYIKRADFFTVPINTRDLEGVFTQRIDLHKLSPGLYVASVKADEIQEIGWIMVTSIGMVTKTAGSQILTCTVDLKTGTPIPNADITAFMDQAPAASGKTDKDGLLTLSLQAKGGGDVVVVARNGESVAFVTDWFRGMDNSGKLIYAYTDRPLYKPGQTVHYKGIVRQTTGTGYAVPSSQPVTIEVRDSRDTLIYRTTNKTDKFGCYFGSFPLNLQTTTGYYTLNSMPNGQEDREAIYFDVAAYTKPEFSVKVDFNKKRYVKGETIRASISGSYYFGSPLANAEVNYIIRRTPYWFFADDEEEFEDYYEDYGGYGEVVEEGTAETDANGEAVIKFPADWEQPDEQDIEDNDQEFSVEVYVRDKSGREANGDASVLVTRGEFNINLEPDRYVVIPGTPVNVSIQAMYYNKRPVKRQAITVMVGDENWSDGESHFKEFTHKRLITDDSGRASMQFSYGKSGSLHVIANSKDRRGNRIVSSAYIWSYEMADVYEAQPAFPDLQIVTDKKTYNPGDMAKILINTKRPGATALVTIEGSRIYDHRTVRLARRSTLVEIPIRSEYKPNFYIGVCYVKNKNFVNQEARAKVSLRMQSLKVSINPDKSKYKPGEKASYGIKVMDQNDKPVTAQLSIGVVDEAIYAISEEKAEPIRDYFYERKPNQVNTIFSFPQIYLSDPDKAAASRPRDVLARIKVRKKFLDTAYWSPNVITDSKGEARVDFQMPDNLTTWRTTIRAVTLDTSCGQVMDSVIARQDLMVRLETPAFLTQSDEATINAVVHNYTGADQNLSVELEAPGLKISDKLMRKVAVRNGGSERLDWKVSAPKPGSFPVTVRAGSSKAADAMQIVLPVYPHGMRYETTKPGAITGSGNIPLNIEIRRDSIPEATSLQVRLAPSLASSMLGMLDYLAQYPYGCTEQTVSTFLPDVILSRTMRELGISNKKFEAELPDMVMKGLFRLYRFQLEDGGWSWCEYGKSDPWMTAYVCYGLIQAREAGFPVNNDILQRGVRKLSEQVSNRRIDINTRVYGYYILSLIGTDVGGQLEQIASSWNLEPESLSYIALGFVQTGRTEQAKAALDRLFRRAVIEPNSIHWSAGSYYGYYDKAVEATAAGLRALMKIAPKDSRAPSIVRWLMDQRQGNYWYSTRDTALILYALSDYLKYTEELNPDSDIEVLVNDKVAGRTRFDKASILQPETVINVKSRDLRKGRNSVVIRKIGSGNLYYSTALVQYITKARESTILTGAGLSIKRDYYNPGSRFYDSSSNKDIGSPVDRCRAGDLILVRLTVNAKTTIRHLLVEDYIPAGCEIIDKGQVNYWEWQNWWIGQDVREERISFYVDRLSPGKHMIEFKMRAGFPGIYNALPAQVFAMYQPSIRVSSAEKEFTIR